MFMKINFPFYLLKCCVVLVLLHLSFSLRKSDLLCSVFQNVSMNQQNRERNGKYKGNLKFKAFTECLKVLEVFQVEKYEEN